MNVDFKIDKAYLTQVLQQLVQINSVNPKLVSGSPGEKEIGNYIAQELKKLGVETVIDPIEKDRSNIIALIKGNGNGRSLMINAHIDTVGVKGMESPFSGKISDGKLYGRGAQDMKGSSAAILSVIKAFKETEIRLQGDLYFSFVIDEEYASIGTEDVVKKYKTDGAIVTEPTNLDICVAHRGFGVYEIKTFGKQAHGGSPKHGVDANMQAGYILYELSELSKQLESKVPHPYLNYASLHVPMIKGGKQLFIYSDECTLQYERRTLPGETEVMITREIMQLLEKIKNKQNNFNYEINKVVYRDAFEVSEEKDLVQLTKNATTKTLGKPTKFIGHGWWEDSALFAQNGSETVIIGPKGDGIHSLVEWVDINSVEDLSKILIEVSVNYCGY